MKGMQENIHRVGPSRRQLLKEAAVFNVAVISGSSLLGCVSTAAAEEKQQVAEGVDANSQYGFFVDIQKCVGCRNCATACRKRNKLSEDTLNRRNVNEYTNSRHETVYVSTACMHCVDPNCVRVCPAGAISKGACGIVSVDKSKCIGCKYCFEACPYEVPTYNSEGMDKCDCCQGVGLPAGSKPYCVQACKFGALNWGRMDELRERFSNGKKPTGYACGAVAVLHGS